VCVCVCVLYTYMCKQVCIYLYVCIKEIIMDVYISHCSYLEVFGFIYDLKNLYENIFIYTYVYRRYSVFEEVFNNSSQQAIYICIQIYIYMCVYVCIHM